MAIDNLQQLTYVIISVAFAIGTSSIILRLYSRWRLEFFGRDELVAVFLLCINGMQQAILYTLLHYGSGVHLRELSTYQWENIIKWFFIEDVIYMFVHWTLKQAILVSYLRLSPQRSFRNTVYGAMILNALFTIANWLLAFLQCRPLEAIFYPGEYPNAKCIGTYVVLMVPTGLNVIMDIILMILPIPTVMKLQTNAKRHATLGAICFGGLSLVTLLCRFYVQKQIVTSSDTTWVMGRMVIVTAIEIEIGMVVANLPALGTLVPNLTNSFHDSHKLPDSSKPRSDGAQNRKNGGSRISRAEPPSLEELGATLTGSEEKLLGMGSGKVNITVTTNVDVASMRVPSGVDEYIDHFDELRKPSDD
ncbi:hypothetical protein BO70DRAFT_400227 [Aspergillus heteromorphus CBS 117.55]|uniref:Rhodopsin domain-containing protein n=1 Tax=Aspergillus heteromorphus CBS 117.55 TaxID=1448321 RepID=A0A317V6C9_9EURO|nr:uncharacterized protein BO70DRAFT_400227 [Aspergillus heteromorphus CBS 117.55]PWY68598.1 hypothetical protein BO70DRAFT_400227 [Aspergillus heteromorphus CBS 117.55]